MPTTIVEQIEKTAAEVAAEQMLMKGAKMDVGSFTIQRDQQGLVVTVKSQKLEDFFKQLSNDTVAKYEDGRKYYQLPSQTIADQLRMSTEDLDIRFDKHSNEYIFESSQVSLSLLRAKGLGEGIEFKYPGVFPRPQMAKLSKALKYAMDRIYSNYIKDYTHSCDIYTIEMFRVPSVQP